MRLRKALPKAKFGENFYKKLRNFTFKALLYSFFLKKKQAIVCKTVFAVGEKWQRVQDAEQKFQSVVTPT